jgi:AAA family ATP:ADP antiporter
MAPFSTRNFVILASSYFLVLLNYSMVRAATTAEFIGAYGAKASPWGWLLAIVLLVLAVAGSNRLQARLGFHRAFFFVSLFSVVVFLLSHWAHLQGIREGALVLFSWKEAYIVMQVHLLLAYGNSWMSKEHFLRWVGPLGAAGGLGGTLGGLLTRFVASAHGTDATLLVGLFFIFLPACLALLLLKIPGSRAVKKHEVSPLRSLDDPAVLRYVWCIAAITALTQFVINIADFQFSLVFENTIQDSATRTAYLGDVYTVTNGLTLVFQLAILPLGLRYVSERALHFFIPLSYGVCFAVGVGWGAGSLLAASGLYTFMKASDYSLFSSAKELLYHPLKPLQKYGAKYLTDMIVYRASKAGIAAVLLYFQTPLMLNVLMATFLGLWLLMVFVTFRQHKRLFH